MAPEPLGKQVDGLLRWIVIVQARDLQLERWQDDEANMLIRPAVFDHQFLSQRRIGENVPAADRTDAGDGRILT